MYFKFIYLFIHSFEPSPEDIFIDFGEKGREREREKQSVASCTRPNWGLNLQPRYVSWPGIEPAAFWCIGQHTNWLRHLARAQTYFFKEQILPYE